MTRFFLGFAIAASFIAIGGTQAEATPVAGITAGLTDLGAFAAGTYNLAATGYVSLVGALGNSNSLIFNPDGSLYQPTTRAGFTQFNTGKYTFNASDNTYGTGGSTIWFGSLFGSLSAASTNVFEIGYGTTVNLAAAGHIYAEANDDALPGAYGDNLYAFDVTVTPIPEPASMTLLGAGIIGTAVINRRRSKFAS